MKSKIPSVFMLLSAALLTIQSPGHVLPVPAAETAAESADQLVDVETLERQRAMAASGTTEPGTARDSGDEGKGISGENTSEEQQLVDQLAAMAYGSVLQAGGSWAVYAGDLDGDVSAAQNSHPMQAASLIKLYIMGAVYEKYDELCAAYGAETVDGCLSPMITVSDNDAANTLVGFLGNGDSAAGMEAVNAYCREHGYLDTSMGRLLLASREFGDNYTSAADCGRFLTQIYEKRQDEKESRMFALLSQQTRKNKIAALMPDGVLVANKTGELDDVENDAAIICPGGQGKNLVLVFLSENLTECGTAQNAIAFASRTVYDDFQAGFYPDRTGGADVAVA